jgi:hypothetical protein
LRLPGLRPSPSMRAHWLWLWLWLWLKFHDAEKIAVDPAFTACWGSYGYLDPPQKPDPPPF